MDAASQRDVRPRFGLMDVFAIIAAFGIAIFLLKESYELLTASRKIRVMTTTSLVSGRPQPPPSVEWNPSEFFTLLAVSTPLALTFTQPLAIASQFLFRRRRMKPLRLELIGALPGYFALAMISFSMSIAAEVHPALVTVLLVVIFSGCCAGMRLFWLPSERVSGDYAWTDWYGVVTILVAWLGVPLMACVSL
jgi:hypothetical protein